MRYRIEPIRGEGGRLDIIDYRCQQCHRLVYRDVWNGQYCPHCGAPVFSAPVEQGPGQKEEKEKLTSIFILD